MSALVITAYVVSPFLDCEWVLFTARREPGRLLCPALVTCGVGQLGEPVAGQLVRAAFAASGREGHEGIPGDLRRHRSPRRAANRSWLARVRVCLAITTLLS